MLEEMVAEEKLPNSPMEVLPSKEMKILYVWKAPARPFKKRNKEFWTTVLAIVFLVALILFFVKEWFLIAAIISLVFVYYVLSTVKPEEVEHKITNRGLVFAGQDYPWENINQFWITEKYNQKVINFELRSGLPSRVTVLVGSGDEKKLKELLVKYLLEEEVPPNFLDKASDWLSKKVPLESEPSSAKASEGQGKTTIPEASKS